MRKIRIEGDLAYVPLTKGYEAVIDAADVPLVEGRNWTALEQRRVDGSVKCVYAWRAVRRDGKQASLRMHRILLGAPENLQVDHKDGNGLNNRRSNLRLATDPENKHNARTRVDNTSGAKGVVRMKATGRFCACIRVRGKKHHLGTFKDLASAAAAYARASVELHGEFGRTK